MLALGLALVLTATQLIHTPGARATPAEPATVPLAGGLNLDGAVLGFVSDGDTLYPTGDFSYIGEPVLGLTVLNSAGRISAGAPRGNALRSIGIARRIMPDGAGGWLIIFQDANTSSVLKVARMTADLQLMPGWPVPANGEIGDVALSGGTLYVAGEFTSIAGQPRGGLAALDATTGALLPWAAALSGRYARIAVNNATLYTTSYSQTGSMIVVAAFALDGSGPIWSKSFSGRNFPGIKRIIADGGRLYIAGSIRGIGLDGVASTADDSAGLLILDAASGAELPSPMRASDIDIWSDSVYDMAVSADTIFLTGDFLKVGGQPRVSLAGISRADGTLRPWRADLTLLDMAQPTTSQGGGLSLSLDGDTLYVGGLFDLVGGQLRRNLAAFRASTGELLPWLGSTNNGLEAVAAAGDNVAVSGDFTLAGGSPSVDITALDPVSGQARSWELHYASGRSSQFEFGMNGSMIYTAAVLDGSVYIRRRASEAATAQILALDRASGATLPWAGPTDAEGAIATGGGRLLIGRAGTSSTAILASYSPAVSTPQWEHTALIDTISKILVAGDTIYGAGFTYSGGTYTGLVFALDLASGTTRWEHAVGGQPQTLALTGGRALHRRYTPERGWSRL